MKQNKRRLSVKTTLRSALLFISLLCVLLGFWAVRKERHDAAMVVFSEYSQCPYRDPIGPNWAYSFFRDRSGSDSGWLWDHFSLDCPGELWIPKGTTFDKEQWGQLENIANLKILRIFCTELPEGWMNSVTNCRSLKSLDIVNTSISLSDIYQMRNLQVSSLCLNKNGLDQAGRKNLIESLCELNSLDSLVLTDKDLTDADALKLVHSLPNCEIVVNGIKQWAQFNK